MNNQHSYLCSHIKKNYGEGYDRKLYLKDTYDNRVWTLEQELLTNYFGRVNEIGKKCILDFACGTGRITEVLEQFLFKEIIGIDVSDSMLKIAKKKLRKSRLIKSDITNKIGLKKLNKYHYFDYITAFRFFLNAEMQLRVNSVNALSKLIKKNGVVVVNVHLSASSTMLPCIICFNCLVGILNILGFSKFKKRNYLHINVLEKIFKDVGFEVIDRKYYSYMMPIMSKIIPNRIWHKVGSWLMTKNIKNSNYFMCFFRKITDE